MSLFADDAKLLRKIESKEDCEHLPNDLDNINRWVNFGKWSLTPKSVKCWKWAVVEWDKEESIQWEINGYT